MSTSPTDDRTRELHERLVTWWFGGMVEGSELRGIWDDAFRRFDAGLRQFVDTHPGDEESVLESAPDLLVTCFEQSLDDHDHILATFPHSLPEGWHEWLGD
ncbi:MAG TPA: hypothetical protein VG435_08545 [Acidimicrobiales bacterium]|jgi:hypothetical protein|nr:hypothetical protein [Acidimicrobiales bacterium]